MKLIFILIIIFIFSLILNYLTFSQNKTATEIINEMGIGYNLGNSFDSYSSIKEINNPEDQITLFGNPEPTKKMILNIKKNGFKTIRFPITWANFIDNYGNINSNWMSRVKEVVNWIINYNMYCIINVHNDAKSGNWLSQGLNAKEKYIKLWGQIANEFKDYDEYLIFESMNEPNYKNENDYNYTVLYILTQSFVDVIRNSGGMNSNRLLLISGANSDIDLTCNDSYKIPNDPANKLAISIHYYLPPLFTILSSRYQEYDYFGNLKDLILYSTWGDENDYNEIIYNFVTINNSFVSKGIPVVLSEVGVLTEDEKEINSIREFLYAVFSISTEINGIMSCLWDTSNKTHGNMNYYMRNNNSWYDKIIKNNFHKISKGKYVKLSQYFLTTKFESIKEIDNNEISFSLKISKRKVNKIIFNIDFYGVFGLDFSFSIYTYDNNGEWIEIKFGMQNGKKDYDGSYIFTIDVSEIECNGYLDIIKWYGEENILFNNFTIEYKELFIGFDFETYKVDISKYLEDSKNLKDI